jgi:fluoride exporter
MNSARIDTTALAWVGLGSALGGVFRIATAEIVLRALGNHFPYGILAVNLLGSFAIGLLAAATLTGGLWPLSTHWRLCLLPGFCGGFTTFSFFSLQTLQLIQNGRAGAALLYGSATVAGAVLLAGIGYTFGTRWRRKGPGSPADVTGRRSDASSSP